jgi:predicted nucleic acid-binding Zn ribbon protein
MNSQKINYRYPGTGAIEFTMEFIEGLSEEQAFPVIKVMLKGELHDQTDKRIKRCAFCAYFYRDKTKPNNSKTCSQECKTLLDSLRRKQKKADKVIVKPKKSMQREMYTYYASHLEYPYYLSEHYMLKRAHNYETPFSHDKLELIEAARHRQNRPKRSKSTPTDGSERVYLRGLTYKHCYGTDNEWKMSQEEIADYFSSKYTTRHLQLERRRAEQFSHSKKHYI